MIPEQDLEPSIQIAALDLGSNSFHLVIAGVNQGEVRIKDKISEKVQLGAGIGADNCLDEAAQKRAFDCLARHSERLSGLSQDCVKVVGTNALRQAKNSKAFLAKAEELLGYEIDIIGGREEARLVYLGVSHTLADDTGSRLVMDIGGGSTEFIIGSRFETSLTESLNMGCVSYAKRFFAKEVNEYNFNRAIMAAKQQLASIKKDLIKQQWNTCVGSSGTIRAITNLLIHQGKVDETLELEHLYDLRTQLLEFNKREDIEIEGLSPLRAPVLPSGLSILIATFETLGLKAMTYSTGALREGLLYDMLGRIDHEDVRDRTVQALAVRYHVNLERANRVNSTAYELLNTLGPNRLTQPKLKTFLGWAADLYQIGLSVAHSGFHKHGSYLIKYSDLPGFTKKEQAFLASLVLNHRHDFVTYKTSSALNPMSHDYKVLSVCLRLALLIQRGNIESNIEVLAFSKINENYTLKFQDGWQESNKLLNVDIENEIQYLKDVGINLEVS